MNRRAGSIPAAARRCPSVDHGQHHLRARTNAEPDSRIDSAGKSHVMREGPIIIESCGISSRNCSRGCASECPTIQGRAVADTAPLLERDFARLAGSGLDRQEHDADQPAPRELHVSGCDSWSMSTWLTTHLTRPTIVELAPAVWRLARPRLSRPLPARCPPVHQLLDHRAQRQCSTKRMRRELTAGYSAATSARTSVPGIARRLPGGSAELDARPEWVEPGSDRVVDA